MMLLYSFRNRCWQWLALWPAVKLTAHTRTSCGGTTDERDTHSPYGGEVRSQDRTVLR
ncbi:hypothetical protein Brsp07_01898 [Brucella sp. NBRC 14130]|uniref:hypothetical protein n=1 Tax=Brucella sp. NBRC 14130 TaxID=3075483 RepID=UPI00309F7ABE